MLITAFSTKIMCIKHINYRYAQSRKSKRKPWDGNLNSSYGDSAQRRQRSFYLRVKITLIVPLWQGTEIAIPWIVSNFVISNAMVVWSKWCTWCYEISTNTIIIFKKTYLKKKEHTFLIINSTNAQLKGFKSRLKRLHPDFVFMYLLFNLCQ